MKATLLHDQCITYHLSHLLYHTKLTPTKATHQHQRKRSAMEQTLLQLPGATKPCAHAVPSALATPGGSAGLRLPADRFALRSSFFGSSFRLLNMSKYSQSRSAVAAPKFSMRVASKQSYVCRDCGYIYNDKTPFEKLPDNYFCPVCGAPKRRFRAYEPAVSKNANDTAVRKARKAQIQRDEAVGRALPVAIVVGVAILGGIYLYLNNTF